MAKVANAGTFKPGQSGNPSGRPKILKNLQELARDLTPKAMAALEAALASPKERVAAASVILDRGYGKAPQLNHNINVNADGQKTDAELHQELAELEASLKMVRDARTLN